MVFLWFSYGFRIFSWFSHSFLMDFPMFPWFSHGFPVDFPIFLGVTTPRPSLGGLRGRRGQLRGDGHGALGRDLRAEPDLLRTLVAALGPRPKQKP